MRIHIIKISQKLRTLREERHFTQEELAKELGVSRQSIISLERGKCLPSLPVALRFSEIFQKSFDEIFDVNFGFPQRKEIDKTMSQDLSPFSPMREVSSLHEAIDKLFDDSMPKNISQNINIPSVNIYEKEKTIVIEAEVPALQEEDLTVEVGEDSITLSGERKTDQEIKEDDFYKKEMNYGSFLRTVTLPALVNKDKAEAELKNGILTVKIPKLEKVTPKVTKIKINKSN